MKQLTLRGFDKGVVQAIRSLARERGISLNRAALILLARGAGLETDGVQRDVIGKSLERFYGRWTAEEARDFERAVEVFETIDEDAWR